MFAVIFEVNPKPEQWEAYLGYAKMLRPELERIDGFIDNERFASLCRPGWVLSLSIWRDEKAVIRWRNFAPHHEVQQKGRSEVFSDYHLRVGEIIADNRLPTDQNLSELRSDETQVRAKLIALSEAGLDNLPPRPDALTIAARLGGPDHAAQPGLGHWDAFESINQSGKFILLTSWRDAPAAAAGRAAPPSSDFRHRRIRVVRDYGMFDRAEAPQHFPSATKVV